MTTIWIERDKNFGSYTKSVNGVYLSYQPNHQDGDFPSDPNLDSANPETAIVIENGKGEGKRRFLIYRGDWRKELETIFPDVEKLKAHYKEHGGHFWSDVLPDASSGA